MIYSRTGVAGPDGFVPGEIRIGAKTWKAIEKSGAPWARAGEYELAMEYKKEGGVKNRESLRFKDDPAIQTFMIHDFRGDIKGCIAPVQNVDGKGKVQGSEEAMKELMAALGTFTEGRRIKLVVKTNISDKVADNTKEKWIQKRQGEAKAKAAK
jgi:hypothetical protein